MSEVIIPALKTEVNESIACNNNRKEIGKEDIVMASEEHDDLTSSDVSTEKVNSGDDEKVQQKQPKEEKDVEVETEREHLVNSTDFTLAKKSPGRGGATSRRGGSRGGARRGGGGRGGRGKKQGPDSFYSFTSDFHTSLFSPSKLSLPSGPFGLSNNTAGKEGEGDNQIPEKILVTPELITQLSANINSGCFYLNNAMELFKQSQLELYHAKFTLEKICRQNDLTLGDLYPQEFASPMEADQLQLAGNVISLDTGEASADNLSQVQTSDQGPAESVQVQLDPYEFMGMPRNSPSPMTIAPGPDFTIGRGGGRGRRGARGGGPRRPRKRREPQEFSSYNSQVSKEGLRKLIKRLDSSLDGKKAKDLNKNRHAAVVLHDIGPVLDKRGNGKSAPFVASKIEASCEKAINRVAKLTRSIFKTSLTSSSTSTSIKSAVATSTKQSFSGKTKLSKGDADAEDKNMEEEKQVSQKENPPQRIDVEENEPSKVPVLVTSNPNNNSSTRSVQPSTAIKSLRRVEDNRLPKKTNSSPKNDKLPRWRQLRVDPEVMDRIKKRIEDSIRSASQSDTDSFYSSVSNSQQSVSSAGKRSKKNSPSGQQSKRPKVDPSSSSSSLSTSPSHATSITSDLTIKSISSSAAKDSPSDEEMLELTPNEDNCDCTPTKQEKTSVEKRGEIVQFSTKVQRVTVDSAFVDNDDSINSEGIDPDEVETENENDDGSSSSVYFSDGFGDEEEDDDDEDLFVEVRRKSKKHEGELIGT